MELNPIVYPIKTTYIKEIILKDYLMKGKGLYKFEV
jgi:hypothetical protein